MYNIYNKKNTPKQLDIRSQQAHNPNSQHYYKVGFAPYDAPTHAVTMATESKMAAVSYQVIEDARLFPLLRDNAELYYSCFKSVH